MGVEDDSHPSPMGNETTEWPFHPYIPKSRFHNILSFLTIFINFEAMRSLEEKKEGQIGNGLVS